MARRLTYTFSAFSNISYNTKRTVDMDDEWGEDFDPTAPESEHLIWQEGRRILLEDIDIDWEYDAESDCGA